MSKVTPAQQKAINKYHKKNYKTIATKVRKEKFDEIKEMLEKQGGISVSKFITDLVDRELQKRK
ncbi:hypothetical protein HOK00_10150 [bacterium]|jgi:hypothetical protein|nr:hypothetical protein [bacterium]